MLPYSREMMFVDISLDSVVSQRPLCGTLVNLPRPLSLMFPYSRRVMIVLRRSLCGVVSDVVFGPFRSIAASSFDRISPGSKHFVGSVFWPNCLSQCCVRRVSRTEPKPMIPVPPSIRPSCLQGLSPHTLCLGSEGWIRPRPLHPMWNRGPQ